MSWELIRYDDFTISLIENDVDKMKKSEEKRSKMKNEIEEKKEVKGSSDELAFKKENDIEADPETIKVGSGVDFAVGVDDANKIVISDDETEEEKSTEPKNSIESQSNDSKKTELEGSKMETDLKTKVDAVNDKDSKNVGVTDGKYLALKLIFQLPSSCYATTALRELLTSDSSFKAQQQLNANFNKKKNERFG